MPDVTEQLRRYGEAVEEVAFRGSGGSDELGAEPRSRRWRWPAAAAAVLLVGIAALVVLWSEDSEDAGVEVDTAGETGGPLFGSPTDAVLVFSDGYDGVLAVDVDAGAAARRVLEGERAGDQPFRLTVVDNELVVGWGEIHAVPLDGSDPHLVTEATTYVPAAEPGEIWTFDYSGGRVGAGDLTLRRVDLDGNVTFSTEDFDTDQGWPLLGVPGGLAVATDSGIAVWDAATGRIGEIFGDERPSAAASDGTRLAWCEQGCSTVRTVELAKRGPATPQHRSTDQAPRFSPDGRHLAFTVEEANGIAVKLRDLETGTDTVIADAMSGPVALQWDPRGQQLFFTETQPDGTSTRVGRYDLDSGTTAVAEVSLQGQLTTGSFIVLPRSEAGVLLSDDLTDSGACAPPTVFPSGREGICAFSVESTRSTPTTISTTPDDGEPAEESSGAVVQRGGAVTAWTGDRLLVWGGETTLDLRADGWSYDPATRTTEAIHPAPIGEGAWSAGVWTGTELIVCCGSSSADTAAAYDPSTRSWRATSPLPGTLTESGGLAAAVWTGEEMLVVDSELAVASYNPGADWWIEVGSVPLGDLRAGELSQVLWLGDAMLVWASEEFYAGERATASDAGFLFDPSTGSWTTVPRLPPDLAMTRSDVAWTGDEVLAWGLDADDDSRGVGARWKRGASEWVPMPAPELRPIDYYNGTPGSQALVWADAVSLAVLWPTHGDEWGVSDTGVPGPAQVLTFDPATSGWLERGLFDLGYDPSLIAAGELILTDDPSDPVVLDLSAG